MNWPSSCSRVWLMPIVPCYVELDGAEQSPPDELAFGQSGKDFRPSGAVVTTGRPAQTAVTGAAFIAQLLPGRRNALRARSAYNNTTVEPRGGFRYPCALTKRGIPHARCHHLTRPVRRHLGRRDVFRLHGAAAGGGHSDETAAAARTVGAGLRQFLPLCVGGGGDAAVQRLLYAVPILRRHGAHADLRPCDAGARLDDDANLRPSGVLLFSPAQAGSGGGGLEIGRNAVGPDSPLDRHESDIGPARRQRRQRRTAGDVMRVPMRMPRTNRCTNFTARRAKWPASVFCSTSAAG